MLDIKYVFKRENEAKKFKKKKSKKKEKKNKYGRKEKRRKRKHRGFDLANGDWLTCECIVEDYTFHIYYIGIYILCI